MLTVTVIEISDFKKGHQNYLVTNSLQKQHVYSRGGYIYVIGFYLDRALRDFKRERAARASRRICLALLSSQKYVNETFKPLRAHF